MSVSSSEPRADPFGPPAPERSKSPQDPALRSGVSPEACGRHGRGSRLRGFVMKASVTLGVAWFLIGAALMGGLREARAQVNPQVYGGFGAEDGYNDDGF